MTAKVSQGMYDNYPQVNGIKKCSTHSILLVQSCLLEPFSAQSITIGDIFSSSISDTFRFFLFEPPIVMFIARDANAPIALSLATESSIWFPTRRFGMNGHENIDRGRSPWAIWEGERQIGHSTCSCQPPQPCKQEKYHCNKHRPQNVCPHRGALSAYGHALRWESADHEHFETAQDARHT